MSLRAFVSALACAFVAVLPSVAAAADTLDAYRALDRTARAHVLATARSEIARAADRGAATPASAGAHAPPPDWPGPPCGVYLSLAHGRTTRACVGTDAPLATLGATLRELARRIVTDDPRHPPLRAGELDTLAVVVAFAGTPEPIADPMTVSPSRDGLLIATPRGRVAFLPGEARTVAWALSEARRAGILERAADATYQEFAAVVLRDAPAPPHAAARDTVHDTPNEAR